MYTKIFLHLNSLIYKFAQIRIIKQVIIIINYFALEITNLKILLYIITYVSIFHMLY
jgi:hypothetical protein